MSVDVSSWAVLIAFAYLIAASIFPLILIVRVHLYFMRVFRDMERLTNFFASRAHAAATGGALGARPPVIGSPQGVGVLRRELQRSGSAEGMRVVRGGSNPAADVEE